MARRPLKMSTVTEVRRAMTRVANLVLRGELTPKEASAIIYAAQTILQSIRVDDQQKRMEELEALLVEMENGDK